MKWLPLNIEIIKNPYNWLVVALMVVILGLSLYLIFGGGHSSTASDTVNN